MTVLGESGGSKTDWVILSENKVVERFTGPGYHPKFWTEEFLAEQKLFWSTKLSDLNTTLYFYGSGCFSDEIKERGREIFYGFGFESVEIESDLFAAGKALFNEKAGVFGILGTGSVLAHWNGKQITEHKGGNGFILDDPGSGYHFGKLLLNDFLNGKLPTDLSQEVFKIAGDRTEILNRIYLGKEYDFPGKLAQHFPPGFSQSSDLLHEKNIGLFMKMHGADFNLAFEIGFVGSYAFFNQTTLKMICSNFKADKVYFLRSPIEKLTDQLLKGTF